MAEMRGAVTGLTGAPADCLSIRGGNARMCDRPAHPRRRALVAQILRGARRWERPRTGPYTVRGLNDQRKMVPTYVQARFPAVGSTGRLAPARSCPAIETTKS